MALAVSALIVLTTATALVWRFREKTYLLAGWLWYLGTLVPVIGFLQDGHQAMADRYVYFSFWGLLVAGVWLAADAAPQIGLKRPALAAIAGMAIVAYACVTYVQIGYWKNSYTLYSHALEVTQRNPIMENDLGSVLVDMGRLDLATAHFQAAVEYMPDYATAHYNLGSMLQRQNRLDGAISGKYATALQQRLTIRSRPRIFTTISPFSAASSFVCRRPSPRMTLRFERSPYDLLARAGRGVLEYPAIES